MYVQGDVMLLEAPKGVVKGKPVPRGSRGIVLALGTATGHSHVVAVPNDKDVQMFELEGTKDRLLEVKVASPLVHEEHGTIELPVGDYLVRRQNEYTPQGIREVND